MGIPRSSKYIGVGDRKSRRAEDVPRILGSMDPHTCSPGTLSDIRMNEAERLVQQRKQTSHEQVCVCVPCAVCSEIADILRFRSDRLERGKHFWFL